MKDHKIKDEGSLPDFFVTAMTLDYRQRIDMQSVWQEHIDASISSTVNVPNSFTVEETERLYLYAYERGPVSYTHLDVYKRQAVASVRQKGYGVVLPDQSEITLEEPEMIHQGNKFGVKIRSVAPSIHMIRANIETCLLYTSRCV